MSRYVTRPRSRTRASSVGDLDDWQAFPLVPDMVVSDHQAEDTGLYDARGDRIFRLPNPMGFGRWT